MRQNAQYFSHRLFSFLIGVLRNSFIPNFIFLFHQSRKNSRATQFGQLANNTYDLICRLKCYSTFTVVPTIQFSESSFNNVRLIAFLSSLAEYNDETIQYVHDFYNFVIITFLVQI